MGYGKVGVSTKAVMSLKWGKIGRKLRMPAYVIPIVTGVKVTIENFCYPEVGKMGAGRAMAHAKFWLGGPNAFGPTNNWPELSLILRQNL